MNETWAALRSVLSAPNFLWVWAGLAVGSVCVLVYDLMTDNAPMKPLMKAVWVLTVLYSGVVGLTIYFYSGRQQIAHDDRWRKGFRSVAHCYSGCGVGEIAGLVLTVGVLSLSQPWVIGVTFAFAYMTGLALTIGPLLQDGEPLKRAVHDAVISESASIFVMEAVAIAVDLVLAPSAKLNEPLFWSSMIVSLTVGLAAAYPVNVLLIEKGIKEGMHDPRHMAHAD